MELNDKFNSGVNVGFWDRSKEGCITKCTVQSDQLGLVQKTYTVADVPVHGRRHGSFAFRQFRPLCLVQHAEIDRTWLCADLGSR